MREQWLDVDFDWSHYPRTLHALIALRREQSRRLMVCSVPGCRQPRIAFGVLIHPGLRQVEAPPGIKPLAYALCRVHDKLTADELGDALYGPEWRAYL